MEKSFNNNVWFGYMEKLKYLDYEWRYKNPAEKVSKTTSFARLAQMNRFNWFWNLTHAIYLKVNKMK